MKIDKEIYKKCARYLKTVINILDENGIHADIKEQLTSFYSNFKIRGDKQK